jgi:hypothetical protein
MYRVDTYLHTIHRSSYHTIHTYITQYGYSVGWYEFMVFVRILVFSMGSIFANIMNNLGKFGHAMSVMVLGSGITVTRP